MTTLGHLTYFQRVAMYTDALGSTQDVATAMELAGVPLSTAEHRDLAARLAGATGDINGSPTLPIEATWDPVAAGPDPAAEPELPDVSMDEALAYTSEDPLAGMEQAAPVEGEDADVTMAELQAVLGG